MGREAKGREGKGKEKRKGNTKGDLLLPKDAPDTKLTFLLLQSRAANPHCTAYQCSCVFCVDGKYEPRTVGCTVSDSS